MTPPHVYVCGSQPPLPEQQVSGSGNEVGVHGAPVLRQRRPPSGGGSCPSMTPHFAYPFEKLQQSSATAQGWIASVQKSGSSRQRRALWQSASQASNSKRSSQPLVSSSKTASLSLRAS